jgi:hypothetical protein
VCFPGVIESEAFTAVVQHLLQYGDAQSWELVLQILIEAAQHISETLKTVASEWSDPLSTNPDEARAEPAPWRRQWCGSWIHKIRFEMAWRRWFLETCMAQSQRCQRIHSYPPCRGTCRPVA